MDAVTRIEDNLAALEMRIAAACGRSGRKREEVRLVAVCKRQSNELVQIFLEAGSRSGLPLILAESYLQELKARKAVLRGAFETHLIGPLQSNKVKDAVSLFDLIESVHTEKIARAINHEAEKSSKIQRVFLQVNISQDEAKSGFSAQEAGDFVSKALPDLKYLDLCGLMTITRFYEDPADARPDFRALRRIAEEISTEYLNGKKLELSMGMSDDFEIAIAEGATLVRIGSALFGERPAAG